MRYAIAFAVVLVLCAGAIGCTDTPTGPLVNGSLRATFDGSTWSASFVAATYSSGLLALGGTDGLGKAISLGLVTDKGLGTYAVADTAQTFATLALPGGASWSAVGSLGSGSITLATLTPTGASGTFSFTGDANAGTGATGVKTITNGSFNVTF